MVRRRRVCSVGGERLLLGCFSSLAQATGPAFWLVGSVSGARRRVHEKRHPVAIDFFDDVPHLE